MKHKAPCSSRGYSGLRESGPLNIDGEGDGDVGEDGGGVGEDRGDDDGPRQRSGATGRKGEGTPFFFFFLDLLPRWEKGFPSSPWLTWLGRGESPSEIGSISLFLRSGILPWHRFSYIRRSVTPIGLKPWPRYFSKN